MKSPILTLPLSLKRPQIRMEVQSLVERQDAANEELVLNALRRLRDEFGSTVVVVTHSPRIAGAADRVIEIRDGAAA